MRIEQLLHGYQDGHSRLAGSIYNLSPKDSARVSMMSDWSGYKDPMGKDHSYITTYYLEDSGYYVIAKSWYAQEMERPGCVWTQSLLIPLTDMPPTFDMRKLQPLFERPKRGEYGAYNKTIEIEDGDKSTVKWEGKKPDRVSLMFILSTVLAGEENFYIKVELDSWWYQQFCLTVLQFLPIEILRRVSLSSGGMHPRKIDENLLTMQFVNNSESISLLSPPWTEKLEESSFNNGLNVVARAMMAGGNDVSALIRIFSNDIGTDEKKYIAICQLIGALYLGVRKDSKVDYKDILSIVIDSFPNIEEGRLVKEGTPKEIFSDRATVFELGLELPPTAELFSRLKEDGLDVPDRLNNRKREADGPLPVFSSKAYSMMLVLTSMLSRVDAPETASVSGRPIRRTATACRPLTAVPAASTSQLTRTTTAWSWATTMPVAVLVFIRDFVRSLYNLLNVKNGTYSL